MIHSVKMIPAWLFVYKAKQKIAPQSTNTPAPPVKPPAAKAPAQPASKPAEKPAEKPSAKPPQAAKPLVSKPAGPATRPVATRPARSAHAAKTAVTKPIRPVQVAKPAVTKPVRPAPANARKPALLAQTPASVDKGRFHICTIAGSTYLFKAVSLYHSLEAVSNDFLLYVCCTDDLTFRSLSRLALPRCVPVAISALEDNGLSAIRNSRTQSEFCWTLKSHFMTHLLKKHSLPAILYCDSDVCFFADPGLLFADWGQSSIYLCTQRDLDWVETKYGKYQAGIIGFRNDRNGIAALDWWRNRCTEWCSATPDPSGNRWGDQKYLDEIPQLFQSVNISTHRGINAAPWNTIYNNNYAIGRLGGHVTIDGDPLIAYHFACIDIFDIQRFDLWHLNRININLPIRNAIYLPYLSRLRRSIVFIAAKLGGSLAPFYSPKQFSDAQTPYLYSERNLELKNWDGVHGFCTISSSAYVTKTLALYDSVKRHLKNFHFWICCMDELTYSILESFALENASLLRVSEVETAAIRQTRSSKTLAEYCWTLKPALCTYVFNNFNAERLLYCDSDLYFFSHPQAVHDCWQGYATMLNRQLGSEDLETAHGIFQAGMVGFTKAPESLEILRWWFDRCTEWCYDNHSDPARWGDQKYLQQIPTKFSSIKINERQGIVAAPWNLVMNNTSGLLVTQTGSDVYIGKEKLICFHFGSLNVFSDTTFDLWRLEPLLFGQDVISHIYFPYLMKIRSILGAIRAKGFDTARLLSDAPLRHNPFTLGIGQGGMNEQQYAFR